MRRRAVVGLALASLTGLLAVATPSGLAAGVNGMAISDMVVTVAGRRGPVLRLPELLSKLATQIEHRPRRSGGALRARLRNDGRFAALSIPCQTDRVALTA